MPNGGRAPNTPESRLRELQGMALADEQRVQLLGGLLKTLQGDITLLQKIQGGLPAAVDKFVKARPQLRARAEALRSFVTSQLPCLPQAERAAIDGIVDAFAEELAAKRKAYDDALAELRKVEPAPPADAEQVAETEYRRIEGLPESLDTTLKGLEALRDQAKKAQDAGDVRSAYVLAKEIGRGLDRIAPDLNRSPDEHRTALRDAWTRLAQAQQQARDAEARLSGLRRAVIRTEHAWESLRDDRLAEILRRVAAADAPAPAEQKPAQQKPAQQQQAEQQRAAAEDDRIPEPDKLPPAGEYE